MSGMDFSEVYSFTGPAPVYSPDGRFIATASDCRVVVREAESLQVVHIFSCLDKVQLLDWCCNSCFLLCSLPNRAQVWSVLDPEWSRKIDEGAAGVQHSIFSPDGQSVLAIADFQIRISICSLKDETVKVIPGPKYADRGLAFSPDGKLLAMAERIDCKEYVSLITCSSWDLRVRLAITTQDLADLSWSPDSSCFVVWDTLLSYKLLVYSSDGLCLASYSAYQDALGIKSVQWCPTGQLLAVGSFDQEVRILDYASWRPCAALAHTASLPNTGRLVAYQEAEEPSGSEQHAASSDSIRSRYIVCKLPVKIAAQKVPSDKPNPRLGIGLISWSADGRYFVTRNDNAPHAVWIWDAQELELISMLLQSQPVKDCQWDPLHPRFVVCTGGTRVYLWSPDGASCVHIPLPSFVATTVKWTSRGDAIILANRDTFCCAYLASS